MKFAIDIGNSRTKIGIFQGDELVSTHIVDELSKNSIENLLIDYTSVDKIIYSSVKDVKLEIIECLQGFAKTIQLTSNSILPFINKYQTPKTLGKDRIAGVAGAVALLPAENVLIIDAGTCITFDLVTSKSEYLGGGISPGITMRFSAMNTFTNKLPLVKANVHDEADLIGTTTEKSMESGVKNGVLCEVDGIINHYKSRFSALKVVVTGGDYKYFDKYLKNNIFAAPNLVLIGLKKILDIDEDS